MFIRLFTFQIKVVPNAYSGTFPLTRIHKIVNERFLRNLSVRKNSCSGFTIATFSIYNIVMDQVTLGLL